MLFLYELKSVIISQSAPNRHKVRCVFKKIWIPIC
ncbi:hypothetical protein CF65_00248 [Aggregatibacter actinomycetemcomitans HK1651]|nr:hypothetical protein CF65_00248 [Aggregatibacter actinomycetemcomitans HK1651]